MTACATKSVVTLDKQSIFRKCLGPIRPVSVGLTEGELAAFSANQELAFAVCDKKREALVKMIDAGN